MKVILLVASIGVICQAAPGGYTAKGGVYKFGKQDEIKQIYFKIQWK